jgi:putative ATP-dependent endonuclease of the OLD family
MQIRHLKIERFRGIKALEWKIDAELICLVGPGDSTKSTILSAIDYALSPRWKLEFSDSDFFNGSTDEPITITVTVGALPDNFKSDDKFGLHLRGWDGMALHDEPGATDELVLSIQLFVDKSLEPKWSIANDRRTERRSVSAADRDAFGIIRIGDVLDRHLSWSKGSALSRMTGKGDELSAVLAEASRLARGAITSGKLPKLTAVTTKLTEISKTFGVQPQREFLPHLDIRAIDVNAGALTLHDGDVPVRLSGLGTRRLLILALQKNAIENGDAIALIDEVEHGLEPHRLRRLLRTLKGEFDDANSTSLGQLLMTTHSPVVVDELPVAQLRIVRCDAGETQVRALDDSFQSVVRRSPEIILSSGILVCEGVTEVGLWKAFDNWFVANDPQYSPLAVKGISLADGQGNQLESLAKKIAQTGYSTLLFADSDRPLNPDRKTLESFGVTVVTWGDAVCTEQRFAKDLPWNGFKEMLSLAVDFEGEEKVRSAVCGTFTLDKSNLFSPVKEWTDNAELREAVGLAAKNKKWFKNLDRGERLGEIVAKYLAQIPNSDLAVKITEVRRWVSAHG